MLILASKILEISSEREPQGETTSRNNQQREREREREMYSKRRLSPNYNRSPAPCNQTMHHWVRASSIISTPPF